MHHQRPLSTCSRTGAERLKQLLAAAGRTGQQPWRRERVDLSACGSRADHLASLYHDDVMDKTNLRRRRSHQRDGSWDDPRGDLLTGGFLRSGVLGAHRRPWARTPSASNATFRGLVKEQGSSVLGPTTQQEPARALPARRRRRSPGSLRRHPPRGSRRRFLPALPATSRRR